MSDIIFQKSLQDVIKGIRSHKQLQHCSEFVSQEITNMKTTELKSHDPFIKAEARTYEHAMLLHGAGC